MRTVRTPVLEIAYEEHGDRGGRSRSSCCTAFPTTRAPTTTSRRRSAQPATASSCPTCAATGPRASSTPATPRSGAAGRASARTCSTSWTRSSSTRAALAGYDWGGRAACIAAALWPERVRGARHRRRLQHPEHRARRGSRAAAKRSAAAGTSGTSTPSAGAPGSSRTAASSAGSCGSDWSPNWRFDDATFERTAASFDNPDFVDVVIHSYRHRYGNAPGDPRFDDDRAAARRAAADHGADDRAARRRRRRDHPRRTTHVRCSRPVPSGGWSPTPGTSCRASSPAVVDAPSSLLAAPLAGHVVPARVLAALCQVLAQHGDEAPRPPARRVHERVGALHVPAALRGRLRALERGAGDQAGLLLACVLFAVCQTISTMALSKALKLAEISMVTALGR